MQMQCCILAHAAQLGMSAGLQLQTCGITRSLTDSSSSSMHKQRRALPKHVVLQRSELRRSRLDLIAAQDDARAAREETRRVKAELARVEQERVKVRWLYLLCQPDSWIWTRPGHGTQCLVCFVSLSSESGHALDMACSAWCAVTPIPALQSSTRVKELESLNRLLRGQMQASTASFKEAMGAAAKLISEGALCFEQSLCCIHSNSGAAAVTAAAGLCTEVTAYACS